MTKTFSHALMALMTAIGFCGLAAADGPAADGKKAAAWQPGDPLGDGKHNAQGEAVYHRICASCHDSGVGHAPAMYILRIMTPTSVYRALTDGAMKTQGSALSEEDKKAVAQFVAGSDFGKDAKLAPPSCQGAAALPGVNCQLMPTVAVWNWVLALELKAIKGGKKPPTA